MVDKYSPGVCLCAEKIEVNMNVRMLVLIIFLFKLANKFEI